MDGWAPGRADRWTDERTHGGYKFCGENIFVATNFKCHYTFNEFKCLYF